MVLQACKHITQVWANFCEIEFMDITSAILFRHVYIMVIYYASSFIILPVNLIFFNQMNLFFFNGKQQKIYKMRIYYRKLIFATMF